MIHSSAVATLAALLAAAEREGDDSGVAARAISTDNHEIDISLEPLLTPAVQRVCKGSDHSPGDSKRSREDSYILNSVKL